MLVLGVSMTGLPFSPLRLRLINWHKWIGIAVLVLIGVRIGEGLTPRVTTAQAKRLAMALAALGGASALVRGLLTLCRSPDEHLRRAAACPQAGVVE